MCWRRCRWGASRWRDRPEEYESWKKQIAEKVIAQIERKLPGFRDDIEFFEVSTPLTVAHFARKPDGAIFGLPASPERLYQPWARSRTPIENLYMTGSDTFSSGIGGAVFSAAKTFELIKHGRSWKSARRIISELRRAF